jgi:hypothetical protein
MEWKKPEIVTYDEVELAHRLTAKAVTHGDGHLDTP